MTNVNGEININNNIVVDNGNNSNIKDKFLSRKLYQLAIAHANSIDHEKSSTYKTIAYNGKISEKIKNLLNKYDINIILGTSYS